MKSFLTLSVLTLVGTCSTPKFTQKIQNIKDSITLVDSVEVIKYANKITVEELKTQLYRISSDEFEGRSPGTIGHKKAEKYVIDFYLNENIEGAYGKRQYIQTVPAEFFSDNTPKTNNVLGFIKGSEKPEEVVVLSAHIDHIGFDKHGNVNNGADDNGSGTVAILQMAQAFNLAKKNGLGPKRSILFAHFTAEEIGKKGSEYYALHPAFPIENTVTDLNMDMIGRIDDYHKTNSNYIYVIGSDRLSKDLHYISEKVNNAYFNIDLDYRYNALDDNNHYFQRSDHYNFANKDVPVIFYFNGVHDDYHRHTDTAEKIDYKLLQRRAQLVFATAWQIANQDRRIVLDQDNTLLN
ncbi:M28 family peptidase [Seonamhaeicola marinus]|uniref:M28 family peptidase n=1 Tax=Seonamhaeicola marinus TaxID=1912246 RepID=A0A5D0HNE9_9FLAO|nr:M28 family peptidase [Seonamhaeicola marinus]TYA71597.1 M28 family peptidase [Seonamhaeicola marinus]